jgi:predicted TIM-barrel fold metal-dependent hydrolase
MTSDLALLDCDTHFSDHDHELWERLAGETQLAVVPEMLEYRGQTRLRIGDRLFPKPEGPGQGNPRGLGHLIGEGRDADRAEFMAANGIAAAVLQPGFVGLSVQAVEDPVARTDLAAAYNTLAAQACEHSDLDLRWAVLLSAEDPDWSLAAVKEHQDDAHAVAAVVRPTARTELARLSDREFTPVLELLAAAELALFVHGGTGCYQWSPFADAYADYPLTHAFGHMGEHMIALADLLTRSDGLPEELKVVLLESGSSWIPSVLERLDQHVHRLSAARTTPSQVFGRQFGIVPDPGERYARWACEQVGRQNVLFGSDYPHWDTVRTNDWMGAFGDLCPPATLRENTARLAPRLAQ